MAWKNEEIEFIKNNYDKLSVKEISIKLNKTNKAVRGKIERLGIKLKDLNRVEIFKWTDKQIDFLKQNYKTMIDGDIAKILFNDDSDKAKQRVYRKRHSLKLYKDERGLTYNDNKAEYKSRFYHGERIFEHIENAEKKLGRKVQKGEIVHHINGDKKDNSLNNLYICKDKKEHKTLHHNLEKLAMELFKRGIIKFDESYVCYFIDENMLT